jgi:septal ring factor EnvC (AmiA/AmiB activator)
MASDESSSISESQPTNWEVHDKSLTSDFPLIGPLVAWFRNSVNSISTKWYMRSILDQQNQLNRRLSEQAAQLQLQLSDQDHELSIMAHDMAEITNQLIQMNQMLSAIETKMTQLESDRANDSSK